MDKAYITRLLQRYVTNQATHAEREALFAELEKNKNNEDWADIHTQLLSEAEEIKGYDPERYQSIINTIMNKPGVSPRGVSGSGPRVMRIWKWAAAAAIVLMIVGGWWMIEGKRQGARGEREMAQTHEVPAPTNTRAVITLADGSKVYLDSAGNGVLAQQNNVNVVRNEKGEIVYAANSEQRTAISPVYNTLFNPRGSKVISLTLSDGTKVWLNSESSLRYPASFASSALNREVEITGEAYFEVAHIERGNAKNAKGTEQSERSERSSQRTQSNAMPFIVKHGNVEVTVLGTHFNVNAYDNEESLKVTLLEGSVKVSAPSADKNLRNQREKILKPGEQAVVNNGIRVNKDIDVNAVTAWQRGMFEFNNADLQTILRQVGRWYDVDVVYEKQPKLGPLGGGISRSLPLSEVLKLFEANGAKFRIDGKKLYVE